MRKARRRPSSSDSTRTRASLSERDVFQGMKGRFKKIETPASGDVMYLFNKWRKSSGPPELVP